MIIQGNAPIYESIATYFRKMISIGVLKGGDALPSVREVAVSEGINPNTVVRAYGILVDEGLIVSMPKKGYFVTEGNLVHDPEPLRKAIRELLSLGYTKEEISKALSETEESKND
ncbi:MAG: GntR family transcriptional regulator [Bacilli bacterium]|nr:GntR family transcriptional regulator [Bacilli bacterium]